MDRDALRDWFTRGRIITLAVVSVLLLTGAFTARPAWRALKTWRAHRFAAEGEAFAAKARWQPALMKAQQALQLSPSDARSQRLMARILTEAGHEQAVPFWQQLLKGGQGTEQDRQQAILAALRRGAWDFAREQLQLALARPPVPPVVYRLASDYYAGQGDLKQGINFARQALQAAPDDGTNVLFVAQRLLLANSEPETAEARRILDAHGRATNSTGAEALALLATRFNHTTPELDALIQRLRAHPARSLPQEFLALDLELKIRPDEQARITDAACRRYSELGDEALLLLGRWLRSHSEYDLALKHVTLERALKSQDLYLVHLDALAGAGRWKEVEAALNVPGAPLDQFYLTIYKVRALMEQGRQDLATMNWTTAHQRAGADAEKLLYLAQYAEKIGAPAEAIRAYRRVTELLPNHRPALLALITLIERTGTTRELRDAISLIAQRFPEDAAAQNDLAYFNALLGENLPSAAQTGELLVRAKSDMLAYRVTLALAWLRSNRAADALALVGKLELNWSSVRSSWRAVIAAVLQANGDPAGAQRVVRGIPEKDLHPEEAALIAGIPR